jgi:hypothetical protein
MDEAFSPSSSLAGCVFIGVELLGHITKQVIEKYCRHGYNAVCSVESQPTFRRYISPTSSRYNKPSTIPA